MLTQNVEIISVNTKGNNIYHIHIKNLENQHQMQIIIPSGYLESCDNAEKSIKKAIEAYFRDIILNDINTSMIERLIYIDFDNLDPMLEVVKQTFLMSFELFRFFGKATMLAYIFGLKEQ